VQALFLDLRVIFSCGLPSIKRNIAGRGSVEWSERESPRGPLPAANSDMSSRSPQLSSEGSGKSYDG